MKGKYIYAMMECADAWGRTSAAERLQVGAIIARGDTIIAQGVNGTYKGLPNACEGPDGATLSWVRHAEAAALDKLVRSTESASGAWMFVTHSPCLPCAYRIVDAGIEAVYYRNDYRELDGIRHLLENGVRVVKVVSPNESEWIPL